MYKIKAPSPDFTDSRTDGVIERRYNRMKTAAWLSFAGVVGGLLTLVSATEFTESHVQTPQTIACEKAYNADGQQAYDPTCFDDTANQPLELAGIAGAVIGGGTLWAMASPYSRAKREFDLIQDSHQTSPDIESI